MERVVAQGTWLHDDAAPNPVLVVRTDYDFWHSLGHADGSIEPHDLPDVNQQGQVYYLRYRPWQDDEPFWPDSAGFGSMLAARREADRRLTRTIAWD